jgi:chemotaxis family two-component system response regulator Rcp1
MLLAAGEFGRRVGSHGVLQIVFVAPMRRFFSQDKTPATNRYFQAETCTMSSPSVGRPMEILLVEDSLTHARLTIGMLKKGRFRHRVTLMRDGEEALEFLQREGKFQQAPRPDLILLDLELPKLDGRELLDHVKGDYDLKAIPVVILTASEDHEDQIRSEMLQVESYMTKPVDVDRFLQVIRQLKRFWHEDLILPTME